MIRLYCWLLLCLIAARTTAQYKQHRPFRDYYTARGIGKERVLQRVYLGIGKQFYSGSASLSYDGPDTMGNIIHVSYNKKLYPTHSIAFHAGTFFPIALLSDVSGIAINTEFIVSYSQLSYDSVYIHPKAVFNQTVPNIIIGIPISIDIKRGGDIPLSKKQRSMLCIGGGAVTGISTASVIDRKTEIPITAIPFIKIEVGTFAGLAFKLRAVAYLRNAININRDFSNVFSNDEINIKLRCGYGYNLSLIIMPFSYGWRTEEWY